MRATALVARIAFTVTATVATQAGAFVLTDLGTLGGNFSEAVAINNAQLYGLIRDQAERLGSMLRNQQVEASRLRAILEAGRIRRQASITRFYTAAA